MKPLFKWAGGKQWLAATLSDFVSSKATWIEPFCGGASLFFGGGGPQGTLSDSNPELINAYACIRASPHEVAERVLALPTDPEVYTTISREVPGDDVSRAVRFVYLNRTSYGGLWRVNRQGNYNVPYGGRKDPPFPSLEDLLQASKMLERVELRCEDYRPALNRVAEGSVVYCDPPYGGSGAERQFNRYASRPFSDRDQADLARRAIDLIERGVDVLVSQSSDPDVLALYATANVTTMFIDRAGGFGRGRGAPHRREVLLFPTRCSDLARALTAASWRELDSER